MNRSISFPDTGYNQNFKIEGNSFWFQHRNRVILELLANSPKSETWWDIGGGNGCVAFELQARGWNIKLLEPGKAGCQNAKARGVEHVYCGTIEDLPEESIIENAMCCDVIEHIEHSSRFLEDLNKKMIEKGKLIITVPAFQGLWSNEDTWAGHFRRYNHLSLKEEVEGAGFTCIYASYFFVPLVIPMWIIRRLPFLLGVQKTDFSTSTEALYKQHRASFARTFIDFILKRELSAIRNRHSLWFGTSLVGLFEKRS